MTEEEMVAEHRRLDAELNAATKVYKEKKAEIEKAKAEVDKKLAHVKKGKRHIDNVRAVQQRTQELKRAAHEEREAMKKKLGITSAAPAASELDILLKPLLESGGALTDEQREAVQSGLDQLVATTKSALLEEPLPPSALPSMQPLADKGDSEEKLVFLVEDEIGRASCRERG